MEAMSVTCQDQGPVNPQDDLVIESQVQGEVASKTDSNSPLLDRKAPRADPEEDIDTVHPETAAVAKTENQESACISLDTTEETQEMVKEEVSPPSIPDTTSPKDDTLEKEGLSSPEEEQGKSSSDSQIISDLTQDQECQEHPLTPSLKEPLDKDIDSSSEDLIDNNLTTNCSPDGLQNNKAEENIQEPAAAGDSCSAPHDSPSDKNNLDDVHTTCPPPPADESEEEKEVSVEIMSCRQQQLTKLDLKQKLLQSLASARLSDSTSNTPAVTLAKLREELLTQIRREIALRGANQETAQQVLSQALPPLSTVAMELSNEGGAASSQRSGCVEAGRERQSRVEEKTGGESTQPGEEEQQTEGGLERDKAIGKQRSGGQHFTKAVQTRKPKPKRYRFVPSKQTRMESDDSQSDSGVSADFSPYSSLDANTTLSSGAVAPVLKETPIEREIRRAIEREHSLRRSRGLPNQPTLPEYVEIPLKKTVLFQPQTTTAEKIQGKDKQFAGKKMQHEIHEEVQREQDLVKLGKVPGFYHKGTVRQLKERKKLFEAFQAPAVSTLPPPARSRARSWPFSSTSDISNLVNQDASTTRHTSIERSPSSVKGGGLTSSAPLGPGLSEGTGCQVIIIENSLSASAQNLYPAKPKAEVIPVVDYARPSVPSHRTEGHSGIKVSGQEKEKEEEGELTPKENPFFKLRTSTNLLKVEQDIREAQEREKELHRQRVNLYGGGGGGRPANTERINIKLTRSSSLNRVPETDSSGSSSRPVTGPPAVRQSVGKLGMWPPAQAEEEKISRPEILLSPRKRTPLVQRWEAGLINGHNQDDD